jgi:hypothetical protein
MTKSLMFVMPVGVSSALIEGRLIAYCLKKYKVNGDYVAASGCVGNQGMSP